VYGPVRTVVWQVAAGDRRLYADQVRLQEVISEPGIHFERITVTGNSES
jgi:hypothetical protein